jgi:L,D-transpeptidase catalytic domain
MSTERKPGVVFGSIAVAAVAAVAIGGCGGDEAVVPATPPPAQTAADGGKTTESPRSDVSAGRSGDRLDAAPASEPPAEPTRDEGTVPTPPTDAPAGPTAGPGGDAPPPDTAAQPPAGSGRPTIDLDLPPGAHGVVWVRRGAEVALRTEPGGGTLAKRVDRRTEFNSPTVFGIVKRIGDWAGVTTPYLPNGHLAWVRLDPRRLKAGWTRLEVVVDLSDRRAALRNGDRTVRSFPVTIGAPGIETPTGHFAVTDTFRGDLDPAYGCCALALSATQPHLPSGWLGGNRIAIHGTSGPLGIAASHGCVRAADADASALVDRVPLGTPVFIRS